MEIIIVITKEYMKSSGQLIVAKKGKIVEKTLKRDEKSFDNTGEENHTGTETRAKIRRAEIQAAAAFTVSVEQPDTTTPEVNKQLTGSKDNGKFMQEKIYVKQEAFNSAKIVQENDTDDSSSEEGRQQKKTGKMQSI